ncbi:MAG TPA: MmgE/PrpD family protein [Xanthobacteraceae bacterium]|jgi:2-methylcitrate dehydratase PrpD|nr:MmgE/PrpD family protein [Xanthobacteraceae bacterium]
MNGINELAEFVQLPSLGADNALREKLALHVLDTVGAWIAATRTAEGRALIAFHEHLRAANKAATPSLFDDLATQVALVRLSEIDDIHLQSMTTPGSVAVPAALTLAASLPEADADTIVAAILAGYDAMIRLGLAIKGPEILYRGIWPTYFGAGFATAAVASRLLRLDSAKTAQALALALTTAAPSVGQHHAVTTARWLSVGNAARNGLMAAFAAQAGFTADLNILQSRLFPDVYGITPDITPMAETRALAFSQVSFKPWCAARQTMAATQALREILTGNLAAADISQITAYVLPPHLKMIDHGIKPGDRGSFLTSLPYQLAVAALSPSEPASLDSTVSVPLATLQSFMTKVTVVGDDTLLDGYPTFWPARVVVTMSSGRYERQVQNVPGDPARPLAADDILRKFRHFAAPVCGDDTAKMQHASLTALNSPAAVAALMLDLHNTMARAVAES